MKVKIKDIAKATGFSVTQVSRALTGYSDVSPKTRENIIKVAKEMGYRPNYSARSLRRQQTHTIGLVIPSTRLALTDPFFLEFLSGIGYESSKTRYDLLISFSNNENGQMKILKDLVLGRRVDGIILNRIENDDERVSFLLEKKYPFVAFGKIESDGNHPYVEIDGFYATYQITTHLIKKGHKKISFINVPEWQVCAKYRLAGYKKALEENNIKFDEELVIHSEETDSEGYKIVKEMIKKYKKITAIFVNSDVMAIGAVKALNEAKIEIGKEIALAAFNDTNITQNMNPPITSLAQPIHLIGEKVTQMLIKILKNEDSKLKQVIIKPKLIIRESTNNMILN